MENTRWPYFDPDYETACSTFNPPRYAESFPSRSLHFFQSEASIFSSRDSAETSPDSCIFVFRVTIENETNSNATVVKVHSGNRHGILLNVVQVLTDLDLTITKSDIFSDGGWFMDCELISED